MTYATYFQMVQKKIICMYMYLCTSTQTWSGGIRQNKMLTTGTSNIGYAGVLCTDVILETFS